MPIHRMILTYKTFPMDLILLLISSIIVIPVCLLDAPETLRIILGLPFILFIPGYVLVFALFPARKTDHGIDTLERLVLSFGLSIAVVPLLGLLLNYTPWGIRLEPILASLLFFILGIGLLGIYRWKKTNPEQRFIIQLNLSIPKQENKVDQALTIILIIAIIIVIASLIYVITMPKTGETFTEFYLLGPTGKAEGYPRNLTTQQNATVIIGIVNREHRLVNYTVEVWLVNQTTNQTNENQTIYHHLWYVDSITTTLPHQPLDLEEPWQPQWTYNYTVRINTTGTFKLAFLLFTEPTETYAPSINYQDIADEKLQSAYRANHLWVTVQ
jgi:uncharacterized membrane protein